MAELKDMAHNRERSDDIDLRSLWQTAVRSLPRLIVIGLVLGGLTYGALSLIAPRYTSETQLAIESKSTANPFTDPSRANNDSVAVRMDREAVNTHVRALMSTDLGERIVREMHLAELPEFNPLKGPPDAMSALLRRIGIGNPRPGISDQDWALEAYFERLDVYAVRDSRFIGVRFTSIDPELAAAVANRIAETYREHLAQQSLTETGDVQQALAPKIARLAEEAAAAEAEVERFRGEANIFKGGQQATGLNDQQLAELNAELSKIKAARSEAEARADQAREMQKTGNSEVLADIQKSPLIQNLVQSRVRVERQISELSATLLPGHPRMRQLAADRDGLKRQIATEVAKIVDGLGKEARVTAAREDAVRKSIDEIKARIVSAGPEEAKLRSLEADAKSKRGELDRLRAQYEANRVRSDDSRTIPVEAQIVSTARPSSTPVFPKKGASAVPVTVATVLIGLALVVTRGLLSGTGVAQGGKTARIRRRRDMAPPPRLPESPSSGPPGVGGRQIKQQTPPARRTPEKQAPRSAPLAADMPAPVVAEAPAAVAQRAAPAQVARTPMALATVETPRAMAERLEAMRQSGLGARARCSSDLPTASHWPPKPPRLAARWPTRA
ncbi:GumC family protein [Hyphomicrobium nitrativorans]|uniref:GumC family protein n=1 Tax=Hyphomicrobium nitrativorans TaxID=1427356 RepID=UPI000684B536|nr:GumC family protein [Hyphomicrobium nitrativorans]